MSERAGPINKPFIVRDEEGDIHAGADEMANAVVLAGAVFSSAIGLGYRPSLEVVDNTTGVVVAVIGQPTAEVAT
jgi:hypothetical protein